MSWRRIIRYCWENNIQSKFYQLIEDQLAPYNPRRWDTRRRQWSKYGDIYTVAWSPRLGTVLSPELLAAIHDCARVSNDLTFGFLLGFSYTNKSHQIWLNFIREALNGYSRFGKTAIRAYRRKKWAFLRDKGVQAGGSGTTSTALDDLEQLEQVQNLKELYSQSLPPTPGGSREHTPPNFPLYQALEQLDKGIPFLTKSKLTRREALKIEAHRKRVREVDEERYEEELSGASPKATHRSRIDNLRSPAKSRKAAGSSHPRAQGGADTPGTPSEGSDSY